MLDGGNIAGGMIGTGGFGGSSNTGVTGFGYDNYGSPKGTNLGLTPQQQVAYEIMQAIYATQDKRFGDPTRLDQYGNPANSGVNTTHGLTGTNMGYNLIDADFTPNSQLANVDLMDPNLQDPMGGGVGGTPAGGYRFGGMTPQNSNGGLMSDGGGERPWWLEGTNNGMGMGMMNPATGGWNDWDAPYTGAWPPNNLPPQLEVNPGMPGFPQGPQKRPNPIDINMPYTRPKRPNLAYGNAYDNAFIGGDDM